MLITPPPTTSKRDIRGRDDHRTPGTQPHLRTAVLRPDTMNTAHDMCAGIGGFEAETGALAASTMNSFDRLAAQCRDAGCSGEAMTLEEWIAETEAERPERALWPSETDARRFRDVWCTGRERLESNAWNDEDAVAYWWLVKSNGSTVTVTERDEVLRGALVPGTMQNWS